MKDKTLTVRSHSLWFIAKQLNDDNWIHNANINQIIQNQNWQKFNLHFRIPKNLDFEIFIHDYDVAKAPSSIQIKDLIIEEDL